MGIRSVRGMQNHSVSNVLKCQLKEHPHVRVGQRVVGVPAIAFDVDDPMGAQQA